MRNENDVRSYPQRGSLLGVLQQLKNETLPGAFIDLEMVRPGFDFRLTGSKNYVSLFCRLQTRQFLRNADWCNCFVRYIYNPNSFSSRTTLFYVPLRLFPNRGLFHDMAQLNTASIVSVIQAPIFGGKLAKTYAVRLDLVRLWELYAILMCQACWMVRANAERVHNVYSIVIDIIADTSFLLS